MMGDYHLKVLVIDDNEINGIILSKMLSMYQFQVEQCESGKAALELLSKQHYDIIFVDYMMPDMNGFEVIKAIRKMEITNQKPLIYILTSTCNEDIVEQCQQLGANGVFEKPLQILQFVTELQRYHPISIAMGDHILSPLDNTIWYCLKEVFNGDLEIDFSTWKKYTFGKNEICMDLIQATIKEIRCFFDISYEITKNSDDYLRKHLHGLKSLFSYIGANQLYSIARELEENPNISMNSPDFLLFHQLLHNMDGKLKEAFIQYQAYCDNELVIIRKQPDRKEWEKIKRKKVIESLQNYDYHSIIENLNELISGSYHEVYVLALEAVKEFSYENALDLIKSINK